jgi:hypothetical protein
MFVSQLLKDFLADSSTGSELEKKYPIEQLWHDVRDVLCHSINELITGHPISLTDLQTDLRDLIENPAITLMQKLVDHDTFEQPSHCDEFWAVVDEIKSYLKKKNRGEPVKSVKKEEGTFAEAITKMRLAGNIQSDDPQIVMSIVLSILYKASKKLEGRYACKNNE